MRSCRTCIIIGCLFINIINGLPQRPISESPVIFIDFNYQGKPGEKTLRSLDQVSYQDGVVNRGRSALKDSYGNPIEYDTLEAVDAKKPSKNPTNPNLFTIPGYASGIISISNSGLQPGELPSSRGNFDDKDQIHFIDPLQNANKLAPSPSLSPPLVAPSDAAPAPSPSLSTPLGGDFGNNVQASPTPIHIPKPNIDLQETPQAPIDDPLNHALTPPKSDSQGEPSVQLQAPGGSNQQIPLFQSLTPPQIQPNEPGVDIPRPNIDIQETPIDNGNGPINQGLLPPSSDDSTSLKLNDPIPSFTNPLQNGPVIITDVHFAPKPSNGLLPPKDPSPNEISFQAQDPPQPTISSSDKFSGSFGGAPVLGGSAIKPAPASPTVQNKFSGSFGGSQGIFGGRAPPPNQPDQIPVAVVLSPPPASFPKKASSVNKYQGSFGGSPGVLVSDNASDRVSGIAAQSTAPIPSIAPTLASPSTTPVDKFTGSFGGAPGVLGNRINPVSTPTQLPTLSQNNLVPPKKVAVEKYTGQFGGAPGVLKPYDSR